MTPETWQRVKNLVGAALELPETERGEFVVASDENTTVRQEAESMLQQSAERLEACVQDLVEMDQNGSPVNARIGAYRIVKELGRGGMGAVYLAERADGAFEKQVAIKILKRGTDTDEVLRRFHAERQILARLSHPNIAGLLDAGTTPDGLPYFVMDHIDGKPITIFASEHRLTIAQRLQLFRVICSAVSYAHQNLVIHRDIKPSNVLVTNGGELKLLDFGIAKLVDESSPDVTVTIQRRLTPDYASPEQIKGEAITTVSDVYSLGVLLYELLTNQRPYKIKDRTTEAMSRAICEQQPDRPSTAVARRDGNSKFEAPNPKLLRGDLDNIVLKALRKESDRRYVSVDQFSADIRRYLEGLPVRARKITAAYRASKFIRRYKFGVAAVVLLILVLIAGSVTTAWEAHIANLEEARAERRFADVRRIANSLMFEFHNSIKDLPGSLAARQLVMRRAVEYLDSLAQEAGNDLSLKSELASAYSKIGLITFDVKQAIESQQKAVNLCEALVRAVPRNVTYRKQLSESYSDLSDEMKIAENSSASIDYANRSLAVMKSLAADAPSDRAIQADLAEQYLELGIALRDPGNTREGLDNDLSAAAILQDITAHNASDKESLHRLAATYGETADTYLDLSEYSIALQYARKQNEITRSLFQADPTSSQYRRDMWSADFHLARTESATGNFPAAIDDFRNAIQLIQSLSSADPADIGHRRWLAVTHFAFAEALATQNQPERAREHYEQAIAISEELVVSDPQRVEARRDLVNMYDGLGVLLSSRGDNVRALQLFKKALALAERNSNHDLQNLRVKARLAQVCADTGNLYRKIGDQYPDSNLKHAENLRSARESYQRSLDIWRELQSQGKLQGGDIAKPDQVAGALAQCH